MENPLIKIIQRCQKNDRKAQQLIYTEFSSILFSICLRYSDNYEDAQDSFQEGFILIFNKIDQYNFQGSFEGWMKKIMVNVSLQKYRKKNNLKVEDIENICDVEEGTIDFDDFTSYQELLTIIQTLPYQYRQVFNLYVLEEYSHQEIATLLNISIGTSKSNLSRARNILKQKLSHLKYSIENEQF
ncbi:MAG: sigma-70 family RNA polymerase sigma factor [Flavobacteriaceae bacterium]|nr:sigma-70 family RNA polymerase sigma factor [Candidatus Onthonaster equi]